MIAGKTTIAARLENLGLRIAGRAGAAIPQGSRLGDAVRTTRRRLPRRAPRRPIARFIFEYAKHEPAATFVQIGVHDGTQLDPLRDEILARRWHGVMVEPVPYVFARLAKNYRRNPRVQLANVAIADHDGTQDFFYLPEVSSGGDVWHWYDALGSFRRDVLLSHVDLIPDIHERIRSMPVPCVTFETLCQRHGVAEIDVVQIDAEGYDPVILGLIDYERHRPKLVMYESLHLDAPTAAACAARLAEHGYELIADPMDTLAVRTDLLARDAELARLWRTLPGHVERPAEPVG